MLMNRNLIPYMMFSVVGVLLISCKEEQQISEVVRPVRTEQVFSTGGSRERSLSGVVKSGSESRLSFKVGGTVQQVMVEIRSKVRSGQVLVKLDAADYEIQVKEAENARDLARATSRGAPRSDADRVRPRRAEDSAAQRDGVLPPPSGVLRAT